MKRERPQTVFQKIRNGILKAAGIYPGILGEPNEANFQKLTSAKAATILEAESETGRKVDTKREREGD